MNNRFYKTTSDHDLAIKSIDAEKELSSKKLENGFLGKFWGASKSIPNNISALTILLLILFGISYTVIAEVFLGDKELKLSAMECWTIISPIITLALGYLFGEKYGKQSAH